MTAFFLLCTLLTVAFAEQSDSKDTWKQEVSRDWDAINHAAAFDSWKAAFGKTYTDVSTGATAYMVFLDNWRAVNEFKVVATFT